MEEGELTMPRLQPVDHQGSSGAQRELLDRVKKQMRRVPNLMATLAHSPAALRTYLDAREDLAAGILPARLREQIALVVAEENQCEYCLAAHSAVGQSLGLTHDELLGSRRGVLDDARVTAALQFARVVVENRGWVKDEDLAAVREAGFGDAEITEIVANVALHVLANYFDHVARPEVDFPKVDALSRS